ncbi:hypothetical protein WJX79_008248 [Trebouxia sp. C0005]
MSRRIAQNLRDSSARERSESPPQGRTLGAQAEPSPHSSNSDSSSPARGRDRSAKRGILRHNCPRIWLDVHKRRARVCSSPWGRNALSVGSRDGSQE